MMASVWEGLREASCCQHLSNPDWRGGPPPPQHYAANKLDRCRESGPSSGREFPILESRRILDNELQVSGQATEFKHMCRRWSLMQDVCRDDSVQGRYLEVPSSGGQVLSA
jgi:hypothetical protein